MAQSRDLENGFNEVGEAWRHSAAKISADLARTAHDAREAAAELTQAIRHSADDVADAAAVRTRQSARALRASVREHPLTWIAGTAGVGALIGLLLTTRRRH